MICPAGLMEVISSATHLPLLVDQVVAAQDEVNLRDLLCQPHVVVRLHVSESYHVLAA